MPVLFDRKKDFERLSFSLERQVVELIRTGIPQALRERFGEEICEDMSLSQTAVVQAAIRWLDQSIRNGIVKPDDL